MQYKQQRRIRSQVLAIALRYPLGVIATLMWGIFGGQAVLARPILNQPPETLHQYFGQPIERTTIGTSPTGQPQIRERYDSSALRQAVPSLSEQTTFSVIFAAGRSQTLIVDNGPVPSFEPDVGRALFRYFWNYEAPIWYELSGAPRGFEGLSRRRGCLGDGVRVDWEQAAVTISLAMSYDRACEPPYPTFGDLEKHWSKHYVEALRERKIVNGYPDGTFRPNRPVTRAEFAALIAGAFAPEASRQASAFRDVASNFWGARAIDQIAQGGFMVGYPNGTFRPQAEISRLQVYLALASGLKLPPGDREHLNLFQDGRDVPDYAQATIAGALEKTLIINYPRINILDLGRPATRADVAAAIYRGLVVQGKAEPLSPYRSYIPKVLVSVADSDYTAIEQQLAARRFRAADELTRQALAQVIAEANRWSEIEAAIAQFPCQDLRHIDRLWREASNGKFGIMAQAELWHQFKADPNQPTAIAAYQRFGEQIGWVTPGERSWDYRHRIWEELTFDLTAPKSHLPALGVWGVGRWEEGVMGPPPGAPIDIGGWDVVASQATEWWQRARVCQSASAD